MAMLVITRWYIITNYIILWLWIWIYSASVSMIQWWFRTVFTRPGNDCYSLRTWSHGPVEIVDDYPWKMHGGSFQFANCNSHYQAGQNGFAISNSRGSPIDVSAKIPHVWVHFSVLCPTVALKGSAGEAGGVIWPSQIAKKSGDWKNDAESHTVRFKCLPEFTIYDPIYQLYHVISCYIYQLRPFLHPQR